MCGVCRLSLRPAPERHVPGVGVVLSPWSHTGAARTLVHHLKYRGVVAAGAILAEAMAPLVPPDVALCPVPRVGWRHLRYGVDPALELAAAISRRTGRPLVRGLVAPWWGRARAGGPHGSAPSFRGRAILSGVPALLVDDVVTSGATLQAAAGLVAGTIGALTATASDGPGAPHGGVTSLSAADRHHLGQEDQWRSSFTAETRR